MDFFLSFFLSFFSFLFFFFFNDTATTEIYTLSLHDALPICCSSDGSGSVSLNSTFVSLPRPAFPTDITPNSSFNSQRRAKSPLAPFKPHPKFDKIAGKVLKGLNGHMDSNDAVGTADVCGDINFRQRLKICM